MAEKNRKPWFTKEVKKLEKKDAYIQYIRILYNAHTDLAEHSFANTYFLFEGQFYQQTEESAMGSSLSSVVANLFMSYFEKKALEEARLIPKLSISR